MIRNDGRPFLASDWECDYPKGMDPVTAPGPHLPELSYEQAKALIFATGTVADGYFGARLAVGFAFDPKSGKTLIVAPFGFYLSRLPICATVEEASYYLRWHGCQRHWDRTVDGAARAKA